MSTPDIVERLRKNTEKYPGFQNLNTEAADEIELLREALSVIDTMSVDGCSPSVIESMLRQAKTLAHIAVRGGTWSGTGILKDATPPTDTNEATPQKAG